MVRRDRHERLRSVRAVTLVTVRPYGSAPDLLTGEFIRRAAEAGVEVTSPVARGTLVVDLSRYLVTLDGVELDLSPRQVELLALFLSRPDRLWSRQQLHWMCWGSDCNRSRRVDIQLCRLRGRTGLDLFRNVRERGWTLRPLT
jgi:two-component system alkaline phosphatase synthesis response regulator PhoP